MVRMGKRDFTAFLISSLHYFSFLFSFSFFLVPFLFWKCFPEQRENLQQLPNILAFLVGRSEKERWSPWEKEALGQVTGPKEVSHHLPEDRQTGTFLNDVNFLSWNYCNIFHFLFFSFFFIKNCTINQNVQYDCPLLLWCK